VVLPQEVLGELHTVGDGGIAEVAGGGVALLGVLGGKRVAAGEPGREFRDGKAPRSILAREMWPVRSAGASLK
jgi:hypothetical protein